MIVRLIAVDPRPQPGQSDLCVYQVPEFSRAHRLLEEVFSAAGIEHTTLSSGHKEHSSQRKSKRGNDDR